VQLLITSSEMENPVHQLSSFKG